MEEVNWNIYQSPFSWRYGSEKMRSLFSEINRRIIWRKVWVALSRAQFKAGLISRNEFKDIEKNAEKIDIKKAQEVEKTIYHDLMAEVRTFAESAKVGGGKIHLGATSTDITDNTDIYLIKAAIEIVEKDLKIILRSFSKKIKTYKNFPCMAYTHLQPAEPTTLGYRFSLYAQDLLKDLEFLLFVKTNLKTKGIKGAVGTSASYKRLLAGKKTDAQTLENEVLKNLGLKAEIITGQTYPRKTDYLVIFALSQIAQSLHKFAFDLRILQSPAFGEWSEPRNKDRVGSSAMPFKRNPDKAEKICSLARYVMSLVILPGQNAANSLLERTLDDSANRRIFIPEAFIATDEILREAHKLIDGLVIHEEIVKTNLAKYGVFAATEVLMMEAVKKGASRQKIHETIRENAMAAWDEVNRGKANPLVDLLKKDKIISGFIPSGEIDKLLNPAEHIGLCKKRCEIILEKLEMELKK